MALHTVWKALETGKKKKRRRRKKRIHRSCSEEVYSLIGTILSHTKTTNNERKQTVSAKREVWSLVGFRDQTKEESTSAQGGQGGHRGEMGKSEYQKTEKLIERVKHFL